MGRNKKSLEEKQEAREIGQRLKNARTRRTFIFSPMTRKELSEVSGIALNSIANYENGNALPNVHTLKKLAAILQVYATWLLYGEGKKNVD